MTITMEIIMFDHSKIDFLVEKFPLINEWQEEGFTLEETVPYTKAKEIPSSIWVGLRRTDTK